MKKYYRYIAVVMAAGMLSCEPELETPVDELGTYSNGEADFSNYVALGNSLTAGYADGALYVTGQKNSYPNIMAQQFALTQETNEFTIPYVEDNTGGLLFGGTVIAENRLVLAVDGNGNPGPERYTGSQPTTDIVNTLEGPFSNMGVPGAKSYHLVAPGYGNTEGVAAGMANPYFARFATSGSTTVLADAMAMNPSFFSLWIGNNDVLGYATSGGTGEDQTNNTDPSTYGPNDITDANVFASVYSGIVETLTTTATGGALVNIPDVTSAPYFTTVPNNALVLDAETAGNLTGFFQAVSQVFAGVLMQQGASQEQAMAMASQYALTFSEGPNRFVIAVEPSDMNPLGFRQMTEEELLLLTIDQGALAQGYGSVKLTPEVMQVLGVLQSGGQPTQEQVNTLFDAVSGITDADVLDAGEIENINNATAAYNQAISAIADANGLALLDANSLLNDIFQNGYNFDAGTATSTFATGGVFSLDGIHLTPRGNAIIANELIKEINSTYKSSVPVVNIGNYPTITLNDEVN
ncbi:G-D-S-L family lipolytic protein [Salegentibacter sp. F14]